MNRKLGFCLLLFAASAAAAAPVALSGVTGGQWEVSRSAKGEGAIRQCVADPVSLVQWEHKGIKCSRSLLADKPGELVVHYSCPAGNFGQVKMKVLTPRSLRIETQGIHDGDPFFYNLYARRVGDC